jgi:hypothetical protein
MRREPDPEATNYPAFQWFDLAGALADNCPACGTVTSLPTTAPAPDVATVGAMARALHFLCAAVRCHYDWRAMEYEGYLDAGLAALRAAGWDPDRARPFAAGQAEGTADRPRGILATDLDGPAILSKLAQLPASDQAQILDIVDRFLQDVTAEAADSDDV